MLAKLLSLLLHAKAGAISGVFLLGATGALVSVSAQNGVTTITITEPSASPSASAHPSASPSASRSPKPSSSANPLSSPKAADACTDQAKANALQVKRVDSAFSTFHTDLMKLREVRDRATVETADKLLKSVRQAAVKAIHASMTCKKHDDDKDEDESHDAASATTSLNDDKDKEKDEDGDQDKDSHEKSASNITFTGDATSIADQAIVAMQTAFDTAKNAPAKTAKAAASHKPETTRSPRPSKSPEGHHD